MKITNNGKENTKTKIARNKWRAKLKENRQSGLEANWAAQMLELDFQFTIPIHFFLVC